MASPELVPQWQARADRVWNQERETAFLRHGAREPLFADVARREIAEAMERADNLGQAIAAQLAEAERELEEIKRSEATRVAGNTRVVQPIRS